MRMKDADWLSRGDRLGMVASTLCAVHCALLPILIAMLPSLGLGLLGRADLDQAFVLFASLLALTTLTQGYRRHRTFRAWWFLLPGVALLWVGAYTSLHTHGVLHTSLMVAGGSLLATAHWVNLRLSHASLRTQPVGA
nr:MerC domain-containing protein [Pseudomarimonas arenosa]